MEKSEYYQLIGVRLSKALDLLHYNQHQLILKCAERGYTIKQAALSKMLSGLNIQILQVAQICEVLEINISEILSMDKSTEVHIPKKQQTKSDQIIEDAHSSLFRGYKGKYNVYFYTTKNENLVHSGTFNILEDSVTNRCMVDFRFKTGEKKEDGSDIEKHYVGPIYLSQSMRAMYCELCSEEIGEKSYLLFRYDFLTYQNLECRLVTAITVSSGVKRLPTMHKLLLTRDFLSDDDLEYLSGQLKLNNSEILLSETAYHEFLRDPKLPDRFFEYFGEKESHAERFLSSVAKVPYISFNESLISDSFLPPFDKVKIICLLRKYSSAPRYNKISSKAEEIIYNYLMFRKEFINEQK